MRPKNQPHNTKLTDRQRRFIDEYMVDQNAKAAARRSGYFEGSADATLQLPAVAAEVRRRMKKLEEATEVTAEKVIKELWRVGNSDIGDLFNESGGLKPLSQLTPEQRRAIASIDEDELFEGVGREREQVGVTKKIRLWDKVRALELLAKKFKLLTDRVEHTVGEDAWKLLDRFNAEAKKAKGK